MAASLPTDDDGAHPAVGPVPGPWRRVTAAFAYPEFRNLWVGACTSSIGTWMQSVAQNWLVLTLTGSALYLGLDAFLGQLPIMLFTMIGGVVADRYDRRRVLLASQYIQMTTALTLALLVGFDVVRAGSPTPPGSPVPSSVWFILGLSFINGCVQAFGGPAYQSLVPALVEKKDLPNAIALNSIQFNLARVIGPLLAGVALATLGTVFCFAANALSFVAVIISLITLRVPARDIPAPQPWLQELRSGLSYVRHEGRLLGLMAVAFVTTFLGMPLLTLLPVFVKQVFHLGAGEYGRMMAFQGAGAVVGALVVAWLGRFRRMGGTALAVQVAMGGLIVAFSVSRSLPLSYLLLFVGGVGQIIVYSLATSLVQLIVPNQMRGRTMSIYMVAFRGGMPLGSLTIGYLANLTSAPMALATSGMLMTITAALVLATQKRLREL